MPSEDWMEGKCTSEYLVDRVTLYNVIRVHLYYLHYIFVILLLFFCYQFLDYFDR